MTRRIQIADLRRRFALTHRQASLLAGLHYGETS